MKIFILIFLFGIEELKDKLGSKILDQLSRTLGPRNIMQKK